MKFIKKKKIIIIVMMLIVGIITGILTKVAIGATKEMVYELGLPRGGNQGTDWGSSAKNLMNGWKMVEETVYTVRSIGGYNSQTVYCIEPRSQAYRWYHVRKKRRRLLDKLSKVK